MPRELTEAVGDEEIRQKFHDNSLEFYPLSFTKGFDQAEIARKHLNIFKSLMGTM